MMISAFVLAVLAVTNIYELPKIFRLRSIPSHPPTIISESKIKSSIHTVDIAFINISMIYCCWSFSSKKPWIKFRSCEPINLPTSAPRLNRKTAGTDPT